MLSTKRKILLAGFLLLLMSSPNPVFPSSPEPQNSDIADQSVEEDCVAVTVTVESKGKLQADSRLLVKMENRCDYPVSFRRAGAPKFNLHKKGMDEQNTVSGDVYEGLPKPIATSLTTIGPSTNEHNESFVIYIGEEFEIYVRFSEIVWYSPMSSIFFFSKYNKVLKDTEYHLFVSVSGTSYGIDPQKEVRALSNRIEFAYPFTSADPAGLF